MPAEDGPQPLQARPFMFEPGLSYLVQEDKPQKAYDLLKGAISSGRRCMCVSRDPPQKLMAKHGLPLIQIIWMSNTYSGQGLPAKNLEELSMYLGKFMGAGEGGLILVDCLEYLISNNNFGIVLKFVQGLKDRIATSKTSILITLNPGTLSSQEFNNILKEMDVPM